MAESAPLPGGSRAESRPALQRCLDIPVARFADEVWGRAAWLSHGRSFTDLFDAAAVDELITDRGLRAPFLRMARNGQVLAPERYCSPGGVGALIADQADPAKILVELATGATLVLQGLHRTWPAIARFTDELRTDLGHPVQVNAYITPPGAQGFSAHYDTHDVFVLQIAGAKRWRIHEPVVAHPLADQPWQQHRAAVSQRAADPPVIDTDLVPGDSLYLPRGWIHAASAQTDTTIHLTFGVPAFTGVDVAAAVLAQVRADETLRANLPLGVGPGAGGDADPAIAAVLRRVAELVATAPVDQVAQQVQRRFTDSHRPHPPRPLAQLDALRDPGLVRLRAGAATPTIQQVAGRARLRYAGRYVEAPAAWTPALAAVAAGHPVTAGQLPGVSAEQGATLVRQLLAEAIVVPVER